MTEQRLCAYCGTPFSPQKPSSVARHCSAVCSARGRVPSLPIGERFWAKVNKDGPIVRPELTPCWIWTSALMKNGYGHCEIKMPSGRKAYYAHRVAYELTNGSIPDGKHVCHRCDNRPCVRPDHLFAGSAWDNIHDCMEKGRSAVGERNGRTKLSNRDVLSIRVKHGQFLAELAETFGVSVSLIQAVISNRMRTYDQAVS